jgi:hypothetical protein
MSVISLIHLKVRAYHKKWIVATVYRKTVSIDIDPCETPQNNSNTIVNKDADPSLLQDHGPALHVASVPGRYVQAALTYVHAWRQKHEMAASKRR